MATLTNIFLEDNKPKQADISEAMQEIGWSKAYLICTRYGSWKLTKQKPHIYDYAKSCEIATIS